MAQQSARRDRDNQAATPYFEYATLIWTRSANSHAGRRSRAAQEAGQMAASDYASRHSWCFPLPWRGRSLIAAPLSRPSFTSPARVMVLFAVSVGCRNIWSGPEDRHCKVHNGLTLITRPSPRRAIACTLALGRCVLAYL